MAQRLPQHRHTLEGWLRRLDRAAGRMNPALGLVALGLVILNLTCLLLLAPHLPITRRAVGDGPSACSSPAGEPGAAVSPAGDLRAWTN